MTEDGRRVKDQAYFNQRFWLACRYFAVDQIADAQRNLAAALAWRPELLTQREQLFHRFLASALDPRVIDPLAFIDRVFAHALPEVGAALAGLQDEMKCWASFALALRLCGRGESSEARARFQQAIALHPPLASATDAFARVVADFALRLPVDPGEFVEAVMANLPAEAAELRALRGRLRGEVAVLSAFHRYALGQRREVPRALLSAVRHRPSLIANRGVGAMFVKSLLASSGGST
jgi:tetratricopeptide (TPR) repeat protein